MIVQVNGEPAYFYTGGRPADATRPYVLFIHGAQNDHSVFALQTRYFAHHGFNVLAPDLPGHGRSKGPALTSVDEMADWVLALMGAAGITSAMLAGHSMGALIALETAYRAPRRVTRIALLGAAYPMKVSDALLQAAKTDEAAAIDMVNIWSHASIAQKPSCPGPGPGFHTMGMARRLMHRMSAINPNQLLHTDFAACNAYANGEVAAAALRCPALFIFGRQDLMTPPRSTALLTAAIPHALQVQVDCGHQMMAEQPGAVLDALFGFAA